MQMQSMYFIIMVFWIYYFRAVVEVSTVGRTDNAVTVRISPIHYHLNFYETRFQYNWQCQIGKFANDRIQTMDLWLPEATEPQSLPFHEKICNQLRDENKEKEAGNAIS